MRPWHAKGLPFTSTRFACQFFFFCLVTFVSAATAKAQLQPAAPGACFAEILPTDALFGSPRVRHCTEGAYFTQGLVQPGDPAFFATSGTGFQLSTDFVDALSGGTAPVVPADVELSESFASSSVMANNALFGISTSVMVENRGGSLLSPTSGGATAAAGAGWGSHTMIEVLPFSNDSSAAELPIRIVPRFSGRFFGSGGGEELNSQLTYSVDVQTRDSLTGELTTQSSVTGTVGLSEQGGVVGDGAVAQLFMTLRRDGTAAVQAQFRPLDLVFSTETQDSLVVTTSFTGFGSFAGGVGPGLADGSETGLLEILSFDEDVRFRHASPFRFCLQSRLSGGCRTALASAFDIDTDGASVEGTDTEFIGLTSLPAHSFGVAVATVPEPATLGMALACGVAWLLTRRRQRY